jgi:serine/threonine protein kinase
VEERLGRYTLIEKIGEGGMATVYRARLDGPMGFQKEVAIKVIRESMVEEDEEHVRSLINEARIGGLLKHPNIVEVYEFGEQDGNYYIAMELVHGVTLSDLLAARKDGKGDLPRSLIVDVAMQVAHGLAYAHSFVAADGTASHVVHRDLKPSNIMISQGGSVKIMDFGIAKSAAGLFDTTATGIAKGTPLYMSPEQLRGRRPLPTSSDLFSLGTIVYEMVTGELLFVGRTIPEIITRVLSMPLNEPVHKAERMLPGIGPILERMLDRDVARRESDPRVIEIELKHLLDWQEQRRSTAEIVQSFVRRDELPGGEAGPDAVSSEPPIHRDGDSVDWPAAGTSEVPSETLINRYVAARRRRRGVLTAVALGLVLVGGAAGAYVWRGTLGIQLQSEATRALLNEGNVVGARDRWKSVLEADPSHPTARQKHAALSAWAGVDEPGKERLITLLSRAPEETPTQIADKYRALARVHRWTGDYRQALVHLTWAREAVEKAQDLEMPIALRWELGEVNVARGADDAAAGYFRDLSRDLPPGPQADAAAAWQERLESGEGDLLAAELRYMDGGELQWGELPGLLAGRGGSRDDREEDRLAWAYRALAVDKWKLAETLVKPLGKLPGESERRRSKATVLAAAAAGTGNIAEAKRQLGAALDKASTGAASAATRLQVVRGLLASGKADDWLDSLLVEAEVEVGDDDPDVRLLAARRDEAAAPRTPRSLSVDARTGRMYATELNRGGPHPARLMPAISFGDNNRGQAGLAWPFGPVFHPFDDSALPVFFHPGR